MPLIDEEYLRRLAMARVNQGLLPAVPDYGAMQDQLVGDLGVNVTRKKRDDSNMLEFWPQGETGSADYQRPEDLPLGQPGLEIGDQAQPKDVVGDLASHYLAQNDPNMTGYYREFERSLTPDQHARLQEQYRWAQQNEGEQRSYPDWYEAVGLPAYFRGYAFKQWPDEFNAKAYTPDQRSEMDRMLGYLGSGQASAMDQPPSVINQDNLDQMAANGINVGLLPASRLARDITASPGANVAPADGSPTAEASPGLFDMANKFAGIRDPQLSAKSDTGATKWQDRVNALFANVPTTPTQMREAMGGATGNPVVDFGAPFAAYTAQGIAGQGAQLADTAEEARRGFDVSHPGTALLNAITLPLVGKSPRAGNVAQELDTLAAEGQAAKPFFSKLYETINKFPDKMKAQGGQLLGQLRNAGVRDDELKWTGFEDWAKRQDKAISKTEALDYLEQNLFQIEESVNETRPNRYGSTPLQNSILTAPIPEAGAWESAEGARLHNDRFMRHVEKESGLPPDDPYLKAFKMLGEKYQEGSSPMERFNVGAWHRDLAQTQARSERAGIENEMAAREGVELPSYESDRYARDDALYPLRQRHPDLAAKLDQIGEDASALRYWDHDRRIPMVGNTKWNHENYSQYNLGGEYADPGSYKEMKVKLRMPLDRPLQPGNFTNEASRTHWGPEENILFHVRFDSRTDPKTGRKLLFVHELQSDWAQAARRVRKERIAKLMRTHPDKTEAWAEEQVPENVAFHDPEVIGAIKAKQDAAKAKLDKFMAENGLTNEWQLGDKRNEIDRDLRALQYRMEDRSYQLNYHQEFKDTDPRTMANVFAADRQRLAKLVDDKQRIDKLYKQFNELNHEHYAAQRDLATAANEGMPLAPYVDKTDKWVDLAMKRMLHYAVQHGYDDIGWTPGIVQTYRNAKRAAVTKFVWNGHTGELIGIGPGGQTLISHYAFPDNIRKYVPAEVATQLRSQLHRHIERPTVEVEQPVVVGERSGEFYDSTIFNQIKPLAKKYGSRPHPFGTHKIKIADKDRLMQYLSSLKGYARSEAEREKITALMKHPTLEGIEKLYGGKIPYAIGKHGFNETNIGWENITKRKSANNDQSIYQPIMSLPITPEMKTKLRITGWPLSLAGGLGLEEFLRQQGIYGEDDGRS